MQNDAMWGGEMFAGGGQSFGGLAVLETDSGQHAEAIGLDEDFAFFALTGANFGAGVVVGAQEPIAIPPMLEDSLLHLCDLIEIAHGVSGQPAAVRDRG